MKTILSLFISIFSISAFAVDPYTFTCDQNGVVTQSVAGLKKAPTNPVYNLNIKVITNQVQLYLIKAKMSSGVDKNLFATDWVSPDELSSDGKDLITLLGLFYPTILIENLVGLRAALPTDLLDGFAYLELKDKDGVVTKIAFQGSTPSLCQ